MLPLGWVSECDIGCALDRVIGGQNSCSAVEDDSKRAHLSHLTSYTYSQPNAKGGSSWHDEGRTDDESQDVGERSDEDG